MSDVQPTDNLESVTVNGDELTPGQLVNLLNSANPESFAPDQNDEVTVVFSLSDDNPTTVDEITIDSSTPASSVTVEFADGSLSPAEVNN